MRMATTTTGPEQVLRANDTAASILANQSVTRSGSSRLPAESPVPA